MLLCEVGLRYEARGLARKQNAGLLVGSPSFADTASRTCLSAGRAAASQNLSDDNQEWKIIYLQVLSTEEFKIRIFACGKISSQLKGACICMPLRRTTLAPAVTRVQAQVVAAGVTALVLLRLRPSPRRVPALLRKESPGPTGAGKKARGCRQVQVVQNRYVIPAPRCGAGRESN
ncbi:MAG: hypothetical protein IIB56_15885 [Planctomycetes bacterium]|nr:hypothetical protein [Planctomycetota bacterium]